jgi:hypothetical protein
MLELARGLGPPGSTTTTRPPRATTARNRSRTRGTLNTDPFDTNGFAPTTKRKSVRSTSGIGTSSGVPYMSALAAKRLFTSCEPDE